MSDASQSAVNELVHKIARQHLSVKTTLPKHRWIVAIDFGTTYSGYAFFMTTGAGVIEVNTNWGQGGARGYKTATVVLLDQDGEFREFGEEAERDFLDMEPEDAQQYFFFQKFKMLLHKTWEDKKTLTRNEKLTATNSTATNKRELPAIKVIAHSLRFMKDNFIQNILTSVGHSVKYDDVIWVLTVPAIWNEAAKQFMREAAYDAGLVRRDDPHRLLMALEPEAAGLWCKQVPVERFIGERSDIQPPGEGDSYVIIDSGGGTVDIAVHKIQPGGTVKEVHAPTGGPWGGDYVNRYFEEILGEMFGNCLEQFKSSDSVAYFEFLQSFEVAKRIWNYAKERAMKLQIPNSLVTRINTTSQTIEQMVESWCADTGNEVEVKRGYLYVSHETAKMLFEQVVEQIVDHVQELTGRPGVRDVRTVFMVGGFSECSYLQYRIKEALARCRVLVPEDPGLSVLKGAVQYGKNPQAVRERVAKLTYGVIIAEPFNTRVHDARRRIKLDGQDYCEDVFAPYISAGDIIEVGKVLFSDKWHQFTPVDARALEFQADIYASPLTDVKYKDKGNKDTKKIGTVKVKLDAMSKKMPERPCGVAFACGSTEIQVVAVDLKSGKASKNVSIKFLEDDESDA